MRKFILVSALILSSSVAFAQFTGPTADNNAQPKRDNRGQMQNQPCMNQVEGKSCDFNQRAKSRDDRQVERSKRQQMNQDGQYRNDSRREHRQYHQGSRDSQQPRAHHRRTEMKQHSGSRHQLNQNQRPNANGERGRQQGRGQNVQ